jgi:hypothetical protein
MAGARDRKKDKNDPLLDAFLDDSVHLAHARHSLPDQERWRDEGDDIYSVDSLTGAPVRTGAEIEEAEGFHIVGGARPNKADEFSLPGSDSSKREKREDAHHAPKENALEESKADAIPPIEMHQLLQPEYGPADWSNRIYVKAPRQRAQLSGSGASRVGIHVGGKEFLPYKTRPHVSLDSKVPMDMNNRLMDGVKTVQRGLDAGFTLEKVVAHLVKIEDPVVRQGGIDMINTLQRMNEESGNTYPGSLALTEEHYEQLQCDSRSGKVMGLSSEVDKALQEERKNEMGEFKNGKSKKIKPQFKAWLEQNKVLPQITSNYHKRPENEGSEASLKRREEARGFKDRAEVQRAKRGADIESDLSDAETDKIDQEEGFSMTARFRPGR